MKTTDSDRKTDEELFLAFQDHDDQAALAELYDRYKSDPAFQQVKGLSPEQIDRLIQQTFIKLAFRQTDFEQRRGNESFRRLFNQIFQRGRYDMLKKGEAWRSQNTFFPDMGVEDFDLDENESEEDLREVFMEAVTDGMKDLSLIHRRALQMHYFSGLTTGAIASKLDIPAGTVKSRLYEARKYLKTIVEEKVEDQGYPSDVSIG